MIFDPKAEQDFVVYRNKITKDLTAERPDALIDNELKAKEAFLIKQKRCLTKHGMENVCKKNFQNLETNMRMNWLSMPLPSRTNGKGNGKNATETEGAATKKANAKTNNETGTIDQNKSHKRRLPRCNNNRRFEKG